MATMSCHVSEYQLTKRLTRYVSSAIILPAKWALPLLKSAAVVVLNVVVRDKNVEKTITAIQEAARTALRLGADVTVLYRKT